MSGSSSPGGYKEPERLEARLDAMEGNVADLTDWASISLGVRGADEEAPTGFLFKASVSLGFLAICTDEAWDWLEGISCCAPEKPALAALIDDVSITCCCR